MELLTFYTLSLRLSNHVLMIQQHHDANTKNDQSESGFTQPAFFTSSKGNCPTVIKTEILWSTEVWEKPMLSTDFS